MPHDLTVLQSTETAPAHDPSPIIRLVLDSLTSEHSRRAYERSLLDFLAWHAGQGRPQLSKALVQAYKVKLQSDGLAPATINQRLSAVRKLAREAADNKLYWRVARVSYRGLAAVAHTRPSSSLPAGDTKH